MKFIIQCSLITDIHKVYSDKNKNKYKYVNNGLIKNTFLTMIFVHCT